MRQCLLVLLLALGATQVCAQRVLSLPDLSALTGQVGTGGLSVDPRSGSIYVTRSSRVSGMKSNGLARLVNGVPDLSWRPAVSVRSAPVFALNGNVYFVGQTADSGNSISVVSVATAASSAPVVRFTPVGAAALPGSGPLQAIAGGYDHWLYFTVRESFGVGGGTSRIGRLDTRDHTVDGWTYEVTGGDAFPVVGPDGSVYVVASSFQFDGETTRTITRLTTGAVAQRVWQRELLRATPRIEGDTQGRLYVMTRGASGPSAGIVRITAEGALDPSWSAWLVDAFFSQSTSARGADMRVVQGGLVATVAAEGATTEATFAVARVDEKGDISALTTVQGTEVTGSPYEAFYSRRLVGATSDAIYFANLRTITLLDPLTLRQKRAFAYVMGRAAEVVKVLALPDGGRLLFGRFDAFYGGRRYRDVLRTGADGNVVQDWQLAVEGTVDDIFLTPRGIVLFGRMTKANGVLVSNGAAPSNGYFRPSAALVSLAPGAAVGRNARTISPSRTPPHATAAGGTADRSVESCARASRCGAAR